MSVYSAGIRATLWLICLSTLLTTTAIGADPKVIKASHETPGKTVAAEGEESTDDEITYSPQWPEPPNTGAMLLRLCVGTVVVLGLCVGTLWFGKPWLQRLQVAGAGSPALYVEGSVAVGNRAMLYLVRVGDTQLIAGTDATGLKSLIAIPASFKEVLDEQIPDVEMPIVTSPKPSGVRIANQPNSKE